MQHQRVQKRNSCQPVAHNASVSSTQDYQHVACLLKGEVHILLFQYVTCQNAAL